MSEWTSIKPKNRRRPAGSWRQLQLACEVAGLFAKREAALGFLNCARADPEGVDWLIHLRREPDNPHDRNAIAVDAEWTETRRRWFKIETKRVKAQLGYVDASFAALVAQAPAEMPIAAELFEVAYARDVERGGRGLGLIIKIIVLVPGFKEPTWGAVSKATFGNG